MSNQEFIVLFPQEYLESAADSTIFGDIEPLGKTGQKISITQKGDDGDGSLVFFPEHWGTCFGINEVKPFEDANAKEKKEEEKKEDQPPKFDITYVLDNRENYKDDTLSEGAQQFASAIEIFRDRLIAHLKSDDVIEELPDDIQMKLKNPDTEASVLRQIMVYPNKVEKKTMKNGKTKEVKVPDKTKPPRIYGMRVLRSRKGEWLTEFQKASSKEPDAVIDPNSLMGVAAEIRPLCKFDYLFVKENKLCLQLRLLEGVVIPFGGRRLGGLVNKKLGRESVPDEGGDPNAGMGEPSSGEGNSSTKEEEDKKARRRAARAARQQEKTSDEADAE